MTDPEREPTADPQAVPDPAAPPPAPPPPPPATPPASRPLLQNPWFIGGIVAVIVLACCCITGVVGSVFVVAAAPNSTTSSPEIAITRTVQPVRTPTSARGSAVPTPTSALGKPAATPTSALQQVPSPKTAATPAATVAGANDPATAGARLAAQQFATTFYGVYLNSRRAGLDGLTTVQELLAPDLVQRLRGLPNDAARDRAVVCSNTLPASVRVLSSSATVSTSGATTTQTGTVRLASDANPGGWTVVSVIAAGANTRVQITEIRC